MLGHEVARILPELRREAESRMTSRATVKRPGGPPVVVDGLEVDGWLTQHADLPGRIAASRGGAGQSRKITVGQTEVQVAVREWHCPASTSGLRDGDVIEVTAGENAGVFLRVVEGSWQDQATARRVPVVEIQQPEGWSA